jgi:hypothetical protein
LDLALLAVQAGSGQVGDVIGEPVPDESRRHKTMSEPPRVGNFVPMPKISFLNFTGTMGHTTQVETLPTRHRAPAYRNAIIRDEPSSKSCVSMQ